MTIRLGGIIFGLLLVGVLALWSFLPGVVDYTPAKKAPYYAFHEEKLKPEDGFSFDGVAGKWDYQQLQRGYQVYKQVCSACHDDGLAAEHMKQNGGDFDAVQEADGRLVSPTSGVVVETCALCHGPGGIADVVDAHSSR